MELKQRTILITGATSGVGLALLDRLAARNERLVVIARNSGRLQALSQRYPNVSIYPCDLQHTEARRATVARILEEHPGLSVVINNAGIQVTPALTDRSFDPASIDREIAINLSAPIDLTHLCLSLLLQHHRPGGFINISSGLALHPKTGSAVYCATKAALHSFSRSLRYQLAGTSLAVHEAILPMVDTPMTEGRGRGKLPPGKVAEAIVRGVEAGREEIYVGKARLMPWFNRLSPALMARIMKSA